MTRGGRGACVCPIPFGTRAKGDGSDGTKMASSQGEPATGTATHTARPSVDCMNMATLPSPGMRKLQAAMSFSAGADAESLTLLASPVVATQHLLVAGEYGQRVASAAPRAVGGESVGTGAGRRVAQAVPGAPHVIGRRAFPSGARSQGAARYRASCIAEKDGAAGCCTKYGVVHSP